MVKSKKIYLILVLLLSFCSFVWARVSITLTSTTRNSVPIYINISDRDVYSEVVKDLDLSGWLSITKDESKAGLRYSFENNCLYSSKSSNSFACLKGGFSSKRRLAHAIADLIFENATGKKGWFSSRIAMVESDLKSYKKRYYRLEVSDSRGEDVQVVFASRYPIMSPSWSPDGKFLAYVSFEGGKSSLWKQNLYTGSRELLSSTPGINGAPSWSPAQDELAFVSSKNGLPKIYILNLATKKIRQVTDGPTLDTEPLWHPDGKSLFFTSNRSSSSPQVYNINLSTMAIRKITSFGDYNATPSISCDGKRLVTLGRHAGKYMVVAHDLVTGVHHVLSAKGSEEQPMIHCSGEVVLYGVRDAGRMQVAMVQFDAPWRYKLPSEHGWVRFASWSKNNFN